MLSKEEKEFIIKNVKGVRYKDLTIIVNEKFSTNHSKNEIEGFCRRNKHYNGLDMRFKAEHKPWNTGTRGVMKVNKGSFKKGQNPPNTRPIGDERIIDGVIQVKMENGKWCRKSRKVYEDKNGKLSKDEKIIHLDGNKLNDDIENLYAIKNPELLFINRKKFNSSPDIIKTGINLCKLKQIIKKRMKEI